MPTVNEIIRDNGIAHSFYIERYKAHTINRITDLLNKADVDLLKRINNSLHRSPLTQARLQKLLEKIRELNVGYFSGVNKEFKKALKEFAAAEVKYYPRSISSALTIDLGVNTIAASKVFSAAMAEPIRGQFYTETFKRLVRGKQRAVETALRIGFLEGESVPELVRRLKGTKAANYRDGILAKQRHHITTLVRTTTNHLANTARSMTYAQNRKLIKEVQYVATLDTRTTDICIALDGQRFPLDDGPRPPQHYNCRSTTIPVTVSWRELGLDIDEVPLGTRHSMNGQVPATQTAKQFLNRQDVKTQNRLIGRTKAIKLRQGKAKTKDLVNQSKRPLSAKEMIAEEFQNLGD